MKSESWVGTKEASILLNVSQRTVQKWIDDGKIVCSKTMGGHRRISREYLSQLMSQQMANETLPRPLIVVLVEDDAYIRQLCELSFQSFKTPYELHIASNGYEGIRAIGQYQPDLLLTDLRMPGIDGFEMIRELEVATDIKDLRIVVITGMDSDDIYKRGGLPANVTILGKPIPFAILENIFARRAEALGILETL